MHASRSAFPHCVSPSGTLNGYSFTLNPVVSGYAGSTLWLCGNNTTWKYVIAHVIYISKTDIFLVTVKTTIQVCRLLSDALSVFVGSDSGGGFEELLKWCQKHTTGYKNVDVKDLTQSWRSGLALCALIHHFRPQLMWVLALAWFPSDNTTNEMLCDAV